METERGTEVSQRSYHSYIPRLEEVEESYPLQERRAECSPVLVKPLCDADLWVGIRAVTCRAVAGWKYRAPSKVL